MRSGCVASLLFQGILYLIVLFSFVAGDIAPSFAPCNDTVFFKGSKFPCDSYTGLFNVTLSNTTTTSIQFSLKGVQLDDSYQSSLAAYLVRSYGPPMPQYRYGGYSVNISLVADGDVVTTSMYTCLRSGIYYQSVCSFASSGVKACMPDPSKNWELVVSCDTVSPVIATFGLYLGNDAPVDAYEDCPLWINKNWWVVVFLDSLLLFCVVVGYLAYMCYKKRHLKKEWNLL